MLGVLRHTFLIFGARISLIHPEIAHPPPMGHLQFFTRLVPLNHSNALNMYTVSIPVVEGFKPNESKSELAIPSSK